MTPAQQKDALDRAERAGVDLSLLRDNLRLTPDERIARHQQALELVLQLRAARPLSGAEAVDAPDTDDTSPLSS